MKNKINFGFEKPEDNLGYLLWQTTMVWQKKMNRALAEVELTHTQFVIMAALAWLSNKMKKVTQTDIAERSKTDRMMVSKILRALEKRNLINRIEHPDDTRAKCVVLTKSGIEILQNAFYIMGEANDQYFNILKDKKRFGEDLKNLMDL